MLKDKTEGMAVAASMGSAKVSRIISKRSNVGKPGHGKRKMHKVARKMTTEDKLVYLEAGGGVGHMKHLRSVRSATSVSLARPASSARSATSVSLTSSTSTANPGSSVNPGSSANPGNQRSPVSSAGSTSSSTSSSTTSFTHLKSPNVRTEARKANKEQPLAAIGKHKDCIPQVADPKQELEKMYQSVKDTADSNKTPKTPPKSENMQQSMPQTELLAQMGNMAAFQNAPAGFLETLCGNLHVARYRPEQYVLRKSCKDTSLHWILQGSARLSMLSAAGEEVHGEICEGDLFGDPSFFIRGNWEIDVIARTAVDVAGLTASGLARMYEKFPGCFSKILEVVQRKWVVNGCRHIEAAHRFLCSLPLFRRVPQGVLRKLARKAIFRAYRPREYIIRRRDLGRDIFFIVTGIVEAFYGRETKSRHADMLARPISRLGPGQHVGEIEYLCFPPGARPRRLESIRTVTASEVLRVRAADLDMILASFPKAYEDLKYFAFERNVSIWNAAKAAACGHPDSMPQIAPCRGAQRKFSLIDCKVPDNIILRILADLGLRDLVKCCRVSRRWNKLVKGSEKLFRALDFRPLARQLDDRTLVSIARLAGARPRIVDLSGCYHITDRSFYPAMRAMAACGNLAQISLCDNWNLSPRALMDLCAMCGTVRRLDLSNCAGVTNTVVLEIISNCPLLEDLDLSYCKRITDKTMAQFARWKNPHLTKLRLARCTAISNTGFCYWCSANFPNMRELVLRDCVSISDSALSAIAAACCNLTALDLTFCCKLSNDALAILSYFCKGLRNLNLSFCGSAVSDRSLVHLLSMRRMSNLTLTGCAQVTREGVYLLVTNCGALRMLGVGQCPLIDTYRGVAQPALIGGQGGERCAFLTGAANQRIRVTVRS